MRRHQRDAHAHAAHAHAAYAPDAYPLEAFHVSREAPSRPPLPGMRTLALCAHLVPAAQREEWLAEWSAEVAHAWSHHSNAQGTAQTAGMARWALRARCLGAARDAIWMRRRYHHTVRRNGMFMHDLRYAARTLLRKPGFTAVVVCTLALCIGANTAIFSVVNSVLLRGLRYEGLGRLVTIWSNDTRNGHDRNQTSVGDYQDIRARARTLSDVAAYFPNWNATWTATDAAERIDVGVVSANFLSTLGVAPTIGRGFVVGEDAPGASKTVILTHAFWSSRFHEDPTIVGRSITLDGASYSVIGVMAPDFVFPDAKVDALAPLPMLGDFLTRREVHLVTMIGRMRGGSTLESVQRELASITRQLETEHPQENAGFGATVLPLRTALLGDIRRPILVLFGAVCVVLLIGCANVANLMLARAASRRHELSLRAALGAERGTIVRQLLTESALIAVVSGGLGVLLALGMTSALSRIMPPDIARIGTISVSGAVLAFTLGVSLIAALLCGLVPAVHGARNAMHDALRSVGSGGRTRGRRRAQSALVITELALSLVLVVSAGLLVASFARLSGTDPGFRTSGLVRMKVTLSGPAYGAVPRRQFFTSLQEKVKALPGVTEAGVVTRFPLHDSNVTTSVLVEGGAALPADKLPDADLRAAGGEYFAAMGIPVLHGRVFTSRERTDSGTVPVAVINKTAALKLFGNENPVGRRMQLGGNARAPFFEVVGVVGDVHDASLREEPRPQVYMSTEQSVPRGVSLVVRYQGAQSAVLAGVRGAVRSLDPALPVYDVQSIDDVMTTASLSDRFTTLLLVSFSTLALLLAALGTYGVIAFGVSERTREIGVRMALGAPRGSVRSMVMREGATLLGIALPLGAAGAWAATRVLRGLLFGVTPLDPAPVALSAIVLVVTAFAASYIPARRASNVDPLIAMRSAD